MKIIYKILVGLVMSMLLVVSFSSTSNFALAESTFYFEQGVIYGFTTPPHEDVELLIPADVNGEAVEKLLTNNIEAIAFNAEDYAHLITSVDLSNATNLTEIGNVFYGCSYLAGTVVLPENIKTIHRYAFADTLINEVVVNHNDTTLSMGDTSFPIDTKILFQSKDIMDQYVSKYDIWDNYKLSYLYDLEIEVGNSIITTIRVENGQVLGELYSEIVATYLSNYDNIELYQSGEKVDENTILDGSRLVLVNSADYTYSLNFDYGENIIIEPTLSGDSYTWKYEGEVASTNRVLQLADLNVGEYIYTLNVDSDVIVYNIIINPLKYEFSWPTKAHYEYYEISNATFVNAEHDGKVSLEYYKYDGANYDKVDSLSIGNFKVVAKPVNTNYYIENNSFEFVVDYSYLTIVWANSVYNYCGEFITPEFHLHGELRGFDVKIILDDSTLTAKDVGHYTINVVGLSNQYFALTNDTVTTYNWEIIPTQLTIDWSNNELLYGTDSAFTINGVYEDISIPLEISDLQGESISLGSVGTYNVQVSIPSKYDGFSLNGSSTGTIEVLPTKIDVVFTCEDTYYYNGEYVLIEATITTVVPSNVELILEDNYKKDAGKYIAKVVGVNNENYYVEEDIEFEWEILPKQLVVSWQGLNPIYNGNVRKPRATVETGIEGEILTLVVDAGSNVNANEDDSTGYSATAKMLVENGNYQLINTKTSYHIKRAIPILDVQSEQSVIYNGKHQLPTYELVGEQDSLKMFVDGIETQTGVKEPGAYNIRFEYVGSNNYKALDNEINCLFIIKSATLNNSVGGLEISISHDDGFYDNELNVEEITEHYIEITNEIAKEKGYDLYKAFKFLGVSGYENSNVTVNFNIRKVNPERFKVYLVNGRQFEEVELKIADGKVSFSGELGTYYVFIEKPIWFATTWGIITTTVLVFVGLVLLVYFTMFRGKHLNNSKVAELVEKRLQEKIAMGQEITTEETLKIRQEVIDELERNKDNH